MTGQITTIEVPSPPRLTGNAAADVAIIADWAWGLYRALVLANPLTQRMDRIAATETVPAFTPAAVAATPGVALMIGSETLGQTITKVNEIIPVVAKVNETVTVLAAVAAQMAAVSTQLNAVIAAADRE